MNPAMRVLLVDPSRFTAPYDAALNGGLLAAGVDPVWAVRPLRPGEDEVFPWGRMRPMFYRLFDQPPPPLRHARESLKGLSHLAGLYRLVNIAWRHRVDVVHFQWTVVPLFDSLAIRLLKLKTAVVVTVHDTVPYNDQRLSFFQNSGFDQPIALADRVIVHTQSAKRTLANRAIRPEKVRVVPHGSLRLAQCGTPATRPEDGRWTFVAFGQLLPYKGTATLIEALGRLPQDVRDGMRVIVAGRPLVDTESMITRAAELGLTDLLEWRLHRLSEHEMDALFAETDCFLFPYHQIDASGVYALVRSMGKWLIASRIGIFAEDIADGRSGRLVPPADPEMLAEAMADAVRNRPVGAPCGTSPSWDQIGALTRAIYEEAIACRSRGRDLAPLEADLTNAI